MYKTNIIWFFCFHIVQERHNLKVLGVFEFFRAVARAPYQVNQSGGHLPPKPQKVGPSVEPGQPSRQPETPSKPKRDNDVSMEVDGEEGRCSKDLELKL